MKATPLHPRPLVLLTLAVVILLAARPSAGESETRLALTRADMCEAIANYLPVSPAVVFTISQNEIFCYTAFDPVPEQTHIFHRWYRRNTQIFSTRLAVYPPKWASYSSMQLRDGDKGPWRVEVVDADDVVMKILRFSISD
jgi:hypothetical protein